MRSKYITQILSVWKAYSKLIFGTTCPVMGTFTADGAMVPGLELCEACSVDPTLHDSELDTSGFKQVDYGAVAQQAGWGNE